MIEDDEELAQILSEFLLSSDIEVTNFNEPYTAISHLKYNSFYDLIILDLSLPNLDGLDVCRKIKEFSSIPIIISSARSDIDDKIESFDRGADDYLPKPYDPKELVARIKTVIKRYNNRDIKDEKEKTQEPIFKVDSNAREIYFQNKHLELTRAEFEILKTLIESRSSVLSRSEIIDICPSLNINSLEKNIDVMIGRIRQKIGDSSKNQKYIKSIRGIGYRIDF